MPFGIKNGPAIFQRFMDTVLHKYKWSIALVYIDDIIVFSRTFPKHLTHVEKILQLIISAGLTLAPKKCHLFHKSIRTLGYRVSSAGLATDEEKVIKLKEFPVPENRVAVQSFLGLAGYYRRFIPGFATLARPLFKLTTLDSQFKWTDECQQAFQQLKDKLCSAPCLRFPDYNRPFVLQTDASKIGLGAVLLQSDPGTKLLHPVMYLSRAISDAQSRYSATELECLAVHWALTQKLAHILDGPRFELHTDHEALKALFNFRTHNSRLTKWALDLEPF